METQVLILGGQQIKGKNDSNTHTHAVSHSHFERGRNGGTESNKTNNKKKQDDGAGGARKHATESV